MAKTLIFGGAFDPPHSEHVAMCKAAKEQLHADRVVIVPTYLPPHKDRSALSFDARVKMIYAAFDGMDVIVDDIERVRGGDNYSAYVLPALKAKYGDIIYLVGGDSVEYLDAWYRPDLVLKACPIAVAAREGYKDISLAIEEAKQKYGGEFVLLDFAGKDVSSSTLRASLLLGEEPDCICDRVLEIIEEDGLFEGYLPAVEQLKSYQSADLFLHSKAVVKTSIDFNSKHHLGEDFDRVFVAALLHDNAKQRPSIDGLNVPRDSVGTPVLHQFLGAEKARRDFGITDEGVLDAIRYHTTARANMSGLEKLIYTGDSLSFDRMYAPIPDIRRVAQRDFELGFKTILKFTYDKLLSKGKGIYPLTVEAYDYYLK